MTLSVRVRKSSFPYIEDLLTQELDTGKVLAPDGAGGVEWVTPTFLAHAAVLMWGNFDVGIAATAMYLAPGNDNSGIATAVPIQIRAPRVGTVQNMYVRQNIVNPAATKTITYTLRVNGVATAISATISASANDGNDLVNTVNVAQGDRLDIEFTKSAVSADSPNSVVVTMEML